MLIDPYQFQPTTIEKIIHEAENAVSVKVATPAGYEFELGQHAVLRVTMPDGSRLVRQYSFSAPPASNEVWFTVVKELNGQVSSWFTETAKVGDKIEISHPFTGPLVHKNTRGNICMIAGGSGIAPLIGFVRQYRSEGIPFTILYSTRSSERCYKDELVPLPSETIVVRLTDEENRFTPEEIAHAVATASTVLLCGSRPFVLTMRECCESLVPSSQLLSEAFSL